MGLMSTLRTTPIRRKILGLFSRFNRPVAAGELLARVRANKTTIYRQLETLTATGELVVVDLGDGIRRWELASTGHHHHLVCLKCKSVSEVDLEDDFSGEEKQIALRQQFVVLKHSLEFFGLCRHCHV